MNGEEGVWGGVDASELLLDARERRRGYRGGGGCVCGLRGDGGCCG